MRAVTPLESEQYLLACALRNPSLWPQVQSIPPEYFRLPEHRVIFQVAANLVEEGLEIAAPVIKDRIAADPVLEKQFQEVENSSSYVEKLLSETPAVEKSFKTYLDPIRREVQFDRVRSLAMDTLEKVQSKKGDPDDIAKWVGGEALGPSIRFHKVGEKISLGDLIKRDYTGRVQELENPSVEDPGIRTGFNNVDRILLGMRPGQMITVGARTGVGKTAYSMNIALHCARSGGRVLFFSLEMAYIELARRLFCMVGQINHQDFMEGKLDDDEKSRLRRAINTVSNLPIDVIDQSGLDISDVHSSIQERLNAGNDYSMIVIDYIQLLRSKGRQDDRVSVMTRISKSIKEMSRMYSVPIISLSQLSRAPEKRNNKRPVLSDLRDSGSVEQDSDVVMLLYRPSMNKDRKGNTFDDDNGVAEVMIEKQRGGRTGLAKLLFQGEYFLFSDLEEYHFDES